MTEAMPFLQKYDITFLRPPTIWCRGFFVCREGFAFFAAAARSAARQSPSAHEEGRFCPKKAGLPPCPRAQGCL